MTLSDYTLRNSEVHWPASFEVTLFRWITCFFILYFWPLGLSHCTSVSGLPVISQCSSASLDCTSTGPGLAKTEREMGVNMKNTIILKIDKLQPLLSSLTWHNMHCVLFPWLLAGIGSSVSYLQSGNLQIVSICFCFWCNMGGSYKSLNQLQSDYSQNFTFK